MLETLTDIRQRLRNKEYHNEEHIGLVRVVQELGWDIWNPGGFLAGRTGVGAGGGLMSG